SWRDVPRRVRCRPAGGRCRARQLASRRTARSATAHVSPREPRPSREGAGDAAVRGDAHAGPWQRSALPVCLGNSVGEHGQVLSAARMHRRPRARTKIARARARRHPFHLPGLADGAVTARVLRQRIYSTLIVPFWPSASRGDRGSLPSRFVTKEYRPGVSEQAVVYRPGGIVTVRWSVAPLANTGDPTAVSLPAIAAGFAPSRHRISSAESFGSMNTSLIVSEE